VGLALGGDSASLGSGGQCWHRQWTAMPAWLGNGSVWQWWHDQWGHGWHAGRLCSNGGIAEQQQWSAVVLRLVGAWVVRWATGQRWASGQAREREREGAYGERESE
jgi:hypothetical protein